MTPKEYLNQYYWAKKLIESKQEEIKQLEYLSKHISPETHESRLSNKITTATEELNQQIESLLELRTAIKSQIDSLENIRNRTVLTEKYINRKNWNDIATALNYSLRQVQNFHSEAINDFAAKYGQFCEVQSAVDKFE